MNSAQALQILTLVTTLGPAVGQFIQMMTAFIRGVESAFPASTGKQKFDTVMAYLTEAYGSVATNAEPLINSTVGLLNAWGEFKHGASSEPSSQPATA